MTRGAYTPSQMTEIFALWLLFAHERRGVPAVPDFNLTLALDRFSAITNQPELSLAEAESSAYYIIQSYMKELL